MFRKGKPVSQCSHVLVRDKAVTSHILPSTEAGVAAALEQPENIDTVGLVELGGSGIEGMVSPGAGQELGDLGAEDKAS